MLWVSTTTLLLASSLARGVNAKGNDTGSDDACGPFGCRAPEMEMGMMGMMDMMDMSSMMNVTDLISMDMHNMDMGMDMGMDMHNMMEDPDHDNDTNTTNHTGGGREPMIGMDGDDADTDDCRGGPMTCAGMGMMMGDMPSSMPSSMDMNMHSMMDMGMSMGMGGASRVVRLRFTIDANMREEELDLELVRNTVATRLSVDPSQVTVVRPTSKSTFDLQIQVTGLEEDEAVMVVASLNTTSALQNIIANATDAADEATVTTIDVIEVEVLPTTSPSPSSVPSSSPSSVPSSVPTSSPSPSSVPTPTTSPSPEASRQQPTGAHGRRGARDDDSSDDGGGSPLSNTYVLGGAATAVVVGAVAMGYAFRRRGRHSELVKYRRRSSADVGLPFDAPAEHVAPLPMLPLRKQSEVGHGSKTVHPME